MHVKCVNIDSVLNNIFNQFHNTTTGIINTLNLTPINNERTAIVFVYPEKKPCCKESPLIWKKIDNHKVKIKIIYYSNVAT